MSVTDFEPRSSAISLERVQRRPEITLILPAFNEQLGLSKVLTAVAHVAPAGWEIIVVDDGSIDSTAEVAASHACTLIRHGSNRGKGAAVRTGIAAASGHSVIIMDADGTYPAEALPRMAELLETHDLVRGIRIVEPASMPWVNRVGNRLFDTLLRVLHGLEGDDLLSGYLGIRRAALEDMEITAQGFDIEAEIGIKSKYLQLREARLAITYGARVGEKKLRPIRDGWKILCRIVGLTFTQRLRFAVALPFGATLVFGLVIATLVHSL